MLKSLLTDLADKLYYIFEKTNLIFLFFRKKDIIKGNKY